MLESISSHQFSALHDEKIRALTREYTLQQRRTSPAPRVHSRVVVIQVTLNIGHLPCIDAVQVELAETGKPGEEGFYRIQVHLFHRGLSGLEGERKKLTSVGFESTTSRFVMLNTYTSGNQAETSSNRSRFHPRLRQLMTLRVAPLVRSSARIASCGLASTASQNTKAARIAAQAWERRVIISALPAKYCRTGRWTCTG